MGRRGRSNFTVSAMSYGLRRNVFARSTETPCPFRQLPRLAAPDENQVPQFSPLVSRVS